MQAKNLAKESTLSGKNILFILPPGQYRDEEYLTPKAFFEKSGGRVTVASSSLSPARGMLGTVVTPQVRIEDLNAEDFDAVLLVGGVGSSKFWHNKGVHALVREAHDAGKVVSAICLAPVTLANSGLLQGKRATAYPSAKSILEWKGALYTGKPVETAGTIVTANGPEAAEEFARTVAQLISHFSCQMSLPTSNSDDTMDAIENLSHEDLIKLIRVYAKNWLAHDGCWFLAAEERYGMEAAMELDAKSWERFAVVEARRIMKEFKIPENGGLGALKKAFVLRLYAAINRQEIETPNNTTMIFHMLECRVQKTRREKGLPDFPCKPVGTVEFSKFAHTVDKRIHTRCINCPPDPVNGSYCSWEFTSDTTDESLTTYHTKGDL